jgi:hypothetical protein
MEWTISSICHNEKKKAEKAEILKRVKERDLPINSFTNTEFAEIVHQVRCEFLNKENKTCQQCKPLSKISEVTITILPRFA